MSEPQESPYYWGMVKKYIVSFGSLFDQLTVKNDQGKIMRVPLVFTQKEKFVAFFQERPNMSTTALETIYPRMAFELTSFAFSPERHTNPMNRIKSNILDEKRFMWNRVPYDFQFSLYVATKSFEESLRIVEQILPNFTPSLNITLNENEEYGIVTDVPVILNTSSFNMEIEGPMDTRRSILWQLDFTLHGHLYGGTKLQNRITEQSYTFSWNEWDGTFVEDQTIFP